MKSFLLSALAFLTAMSLNAAEATNLSPDEAEKLLKEHKGIVVLDVRTPEEYAAGHIPGAKNVDFYADDFARKVEALDKSKEYLVHCAAGGRSAKACKLMGEDKFAKVYHLPGGFTEWQKAGKAVEK